jgi:GT2 family glycosyltransferase
VSSKTTVVIPNYNGIKYLKDCLDSLKLCKPADFDIIVADDGSTDGSVELIKSEYSDVILLQSENNTGFAATVNRGINKADTEYVILLNNDTKVAPDFVHNLENAIESDERIFSASAKMLCMNDPEILDGAGDYYCAFGWAYAYGKGKKADALNRRRKIFSSCGGAAIYRRNALTELGLFDEEHFAYLEDIDVGYRSRLSGYINVFEPSAVCLHAGSGFSGSRYNEFKIRLSSRNNTYLIVKNMPVIQQIINLPFFMIGFLIKWLFFVKKGFGWLYLKGLFAGIALGYGSVGKKHRVRFKLANLPFYIIVQIELWVNMIRFFIRGI